MERAKAFFVVGHKHWGKSSTLRALTDGSSHRGWWRIGSDRFFVRRMSNDDIPDDFYTLLGKLDPAEKPLVIITLCPTFEDEEARAKLIGALQDFKRKYELYFFVLRHSYSDERQISDDEIANMKRFGTVDKFSSRRTEMGERGKALEKFIQASM
jgi:hypothetical protein